MAGKMATKSLESVFYEDMWTAENNIVGLS
jgi:hypothetical protein